MSRGPRLVSNTVYLLGGLLLALVAGIIYGGGSSVKHPTAEPSADLSMPQGSEMVLNNIHHEAVRDGILDWVLDAKLAQFDDKGQSALIEGINLTMFDSNRSETAVEAIRGKINMLTNDFTLRKNVRVHFKDYVLEAQRVVYSNEKKTITSNERVNIKGKSIKLVADSLNYNLNTQNAVLKGNVTAVIGDTSDE